MRCGKKNNGNKMYFNFRLTSQNIDLIAEETIYSELLYYVDSESIFIFSDRSTPRLVTREPK